MRPSSGVERRFARKDLSLRDGVNVSLAVVLVLCSFLAVSGAMVMERMFGAIDRLFADAKPPHFLQMHTGEHDQAALDSFASEHPEIESWFVLEMVGFDGAAVTWASADGARTGDLSDHLIDNLFITQNKDFDHLLDEQGGIPTPSQGEVYVPVAYQDDLDLAAGDKLTVTTEQGKVDLTIAGFVRDAQMASSLSSATRFVVSDEDFKALTSGGGGSEEIIVQYRLSDPGKAGEFQTAYENAQGVPKTGQAVTYDMIRLINAFSDGMLAFGLALVSLLFLIVAFICQRFVIRATLQDQVRQIGAMKAIGIPSKAISRLFGTKYRILALVSGVVGLVLACIAVPFLTQNIARSYAPAGISWTTVVVPAVTLLAFLALVLLMCWLNLRSVNKIEPVTAMVHGRTSPERRGGARPGRRVSTSGPQAADRSLMLNDLRKEAGQWILIPLILALVTVAMVIPTNLLSTFQDPRFVTYMGAPQRDLRVDVQFSDNAAAEARQIVEDLEADDRISSVEQYGVLQVPADSPEGRLHIRTEVGDYQATSQEFSSGKAPTNGEIALSVLSADEFQVKVGDQIEVILAERPTKLTVSGIYQDVTGGGRTARLAGSVPDDASGYVIYADVQDDADPLQVVEQWRQRHPDADIVPMREYVKQTMSYVTDAFRAAVILAVVLGLGVVGLMVALFVQLRVARDRRRIGILNAMGYTGGEVARQYWAKTVLAAIIGVTLGVVLAATLGEFLVGGAMAAGGFGISSLSFMPWVPVVYVLYPVLLVLVSFGASVLVTRSLTTRSKSSWLRD